MRLALLILSILVLSCNQEEKVPNYVWPEERFVEVLTEFQITESIVRLGFYKNQDSVYLKDSVYQAMFNKLEITRNEFDTNFSYYLKDPKLMEGIYDKVMVNLSERSAEIKGDQEKN